MQEQCRWQELGHKFLLNEIACASMMLFISGYGVKQLENVSVAILMIRRNLHRLQKHISLLWIIE